MTEPTAQPDPPTGCLLPKAAPAEHCGHVAPTTLLTTRRTECVLRPGHSGSHVDDRGCRWWPTPPPEPADGPQGDQETADEGEGGSDARGGAQAAQGGSGLLGAALAAQLGRPLYDRINQHLADGQQAEAALDRVQALIHQHPVAIPTNLLDEALNQGAHNNGPSVKECAEADRAHWTTKYAGEGQ